jgi:large subunit ribosomal protein L24
MEQKFSSAWISSRQPRKQRKFRANAPLHLRHKFLSATLSKELRKKYGKRSVPVRKGDEVLVMRGKFAKKTAKVDSVNLTKSRLNLEGLQATKRDGTKVAFPINASNVMIKVLNLEDKKRIKALTGTESAPEKKAEKKTDKKPETKKETKAPAKKKGTKK